MIARERLAVGRSGSRVLRVLAACFLAWAWAGGSRGAEDRAGPEPAWPSREAVRRDPGLIVTPGHVFDPLLDPLPPGGSWPAGGPASPSRLGGVWLLVQFEGPQRRAEDAEALRDAGAVAEARVPNAAWLVRADEAAVGRIRALRGLRWLGPYRPSYRVHPELLRLAPGGEPVDLFVTFFPEERASDYGDEIASAPGVADVRPLTRVAADGPDRIRLRVDGARLGEVLAVLARLGGVRLIEHAPPLAVQNDRAVPWHQTATAIGDRDLTQKVHGKGVVGYRQIVAVADTGLENDSCYFRYGSGLEDVTYCRHVLDTDSPNFQIYDPCNKVIAIYRSSALAICYYDIQHGTVVAGTIAGDSHLDDAGSECGEPCLAAICEEAVPGEPVLRLTGRTPSEHHQSGDGMAPGAQLVIQDYGTATGALEILDPAASLAQAWNSGARTQCNAWGEISMNCITNPDYDLRSALIDGFTFAHRTMSVIFAAGNEGGCGAQSLAGAGSVALNTITVGWATGPDGNDVSPSSSKGPTLDGRLEPDLVALGDLASAGTTSPRPAIEGGDPGDQDCGQTWGGGTSFASGVVAGLAALVGQYFEDGYYPTGRPTRGFWAVPGIPLADQPELSGKCASEPSLCDPGDSFSPTNALVKAVLLNATRSLDGANTGDTNGVRKPRPTFGQGWGSPILDDVLFFAGDPTRPGERTGLRVLTDTPNGVDGAFPLKDQRESVVEGFTPCFTGAFEDEIKYWAVPDVRAGEPLVATLVWSHPEPDSIAFPLENDLDLELIGPDPATGDPDDLFVWRPNPAVAYSGPSGERDGWVQTETLRALGEGKTCHGAPGPPVCSPPLPPASWPLYESADHVNNVEQIALRASDVVGGTYYVRVLNWRIDGSGFYRDGAPDLERETPVDLGHDEFTGGEQGFALFLSGKLGGCFPPAATITSVSPGTEVCVGETVTFEGAGAGEGPLALEWDFDYDGAAFDVMAAGSPVSHAYGAPGTYTVALRVTDSCPDPGPQTAMDTVLVTVLESAVGEVSDTRSGEPPLRVAPRGTAVTVEREAPAAAYNVYADRIGSWYAPARATGSLCHVPAWTDNGDGTVTLDYAVPTGSWIVVTASDRCGEGPDGRDSTGRERTTLGTWALCGPAP
jgi:hypothetical protein